jgi:excisionase family DNA binding protein
MGKTQVVQCRTLPCSCLSGFWLAKPLLTAANVADQLQVSIRTIRREIAAGRLKVIRIGRLLRIRSAALEAYMTAAAGE